MLHRVTRFLSTVIALLLLAACVVFPDAASAADDCFARPAGAVPNGSHWYYRINNVTQQKCWFLGVKKAAVRNVGLQRSYNFANPKEVAPPAVGCIAAPDSRAEPGKRWYYRTDKAIGQRCWRLGAKVSRISDAVPVGPAESAKPAAPDTRIVTLPPTVADAKAKFLDAVSKPRRPIETALAPEPVIPGIADETLAMPTFVARWVDPPTLARSSDGEPNPSRDPDIHRTVATAFEDVTNSVKATGPLFKAEPPLDVTLTVFLLSLGSALALFTLTGGPFLFERMAPAQSWNPPLRLPPDLDDAPNSIRGNRKSVLDFCGEHDGSEFRPPALRARSMTGLP